MALTLNRVVPSLMGPGNAQVRRPFPQFTIDAPDIGNSIYNGMNVRMQKRYSHGLHFQANYTFARFIDDIASRNEPAPLRTISRTSTIIAAIRGLSGFDVAHRLVFGSVWELPFGHGRPLDIRNRVLDGLIGGWSAGYIAVVQTGQP